jgi:hypothetical protein
MSESSNAYVVVVENDVSYNSRTGAKMESSYCWIRNQSESVALLSRTADPEIARVFAASPEMLEVLQDLQVILPTALHNGHHDLIQRVNEVIKKARGES